MKQELLNHILFACASPPARAAWIETKTGKRPCLDMRSPPSRAAWIETPLARPRAAASGVAALAGGVD